MLLVGEATASRPGMGDRDLRPLEEEEPMVGWGRDTRPQGRVLPHSAVGTRRRMKSGDGKVRGKG